MAVHEWMVKRSAVPKPRQGLIMVPENMIPLHNQSCHIPYGQGKEMAKRCLRHLVPRIFSARKIGEWYVSLRQDHGLSLPAGWLVPPKALPMQMALRRFEHGAKILGIPHDEMDWVIPGNGDVRAMVVFKWQGYKNKPKPPEKWKDYGLGGLLEAMDTGYWLDYLYGLINAWEE
jgi:hypothetical protein